MITMIRPPALLLEIIDTGSYRGGAISTAVSKASSIPLVPEPTGGRNHQNPIRYLWSSNSLALDLLSSKRDQSMRRYLVPSPPHSSSAGMIRRCQHLGSLL